MCRLVRELSPQLEIVVGGHVTAIPGIESMIDADHFVQRRGHRVDARISRRGSRLRPIRHPEIVSGMQTRIMGVRLPDRKGRLRPR